MSRNIRLPLRLLRHLGWRFGFVFLASSSSLTILVWLTQFRRSSYLLESHALSLTLVFKLFMLLLPFIFTFTCTFCVFIAACFVLYRLIDNSELSILYSMGLGPWHIARPFLLLCIPIAIALQICLLYLSPYAMRTLRNKTTQIEENFFLSALQIEKFIKPTDNMTIYVNGRKNKKLQGVFVYNTSKDTPTIYTAKSAELFRQGSMLRFQLNNGSIQIKQKNQAPMILYFKNYIYDLPSSSPKKEDLYEDQRYLGELFENDSYALAHRGDFYAEINRRLSATLFVFAFCFLALATFLPQPLHRQGFFMRSLLGVVAAVALYIFEYIYGQSVPRERLFFALIYVLPILYIIASALELSNRGPSRWLAAVRFKRWRDP